MRKQIFTFISWFFAGFVIAWFLFDPKTALGLAVVVLLFFGVWLIDGQIVVKDGQFYVPMDPEKYKKENKKNKNQKQTQHGKIYFV